MAGDDNLLADAMRKLIVPAERLDQRLRRGRGITVIAKDTYEQSLVSPIAPCRTDPAYIFSALDVLRAFAIPSKDELSAVSEIAVEGLARLEHRVAVELRLPLVVMC